MMDLQRLWSRPEYIKGLLVLLTIFPLAVVLHLYWLTPSSLARNGPGSSDEFVTRWLQSNLVQPFNPSAVSRYCNETAWRPNVILNLQDTNGGIGNVRGSILDFLFFAIENGASILMPSISARSESGYATAVKLAFNTWFDEDWFVQSMAVACPQMAIYQPWANESATRVASNVYQPQSRRMDTAFSNTRANSRQHFKSWLEIQSEYAEAELTLVNVARQLWQVDTRSLPSGLRRGLSQILQSNPTIRNLAARVIESLADRVGDKIKITPGDAIHRHAFYGAHLPYIAPQDINNESSSANENRTVLINGLLAHADRANLSVVYLASGSDDDILHFEHQAAHIGNTRRSIVTKYDLLPDSYAAILDDLSWDQQSLIDYEVLRRSSVFGGAAESSFSYAVTMARSQWLEDHGRAAKPWFARHREENVTFDDGLSRIVGVDTWHVDLIPRAMWP